MEKRPFLLAVCGEKNTGKTTLLEKLIAALAARGLKVATIKHDGHEFSADVPETDTHRHMAAGAYGTAVFDGGKFMVVKREENVSEQQLALLFPEADIILLEGFKHSAYPKLQMLRTGVSEQLICNGLNLFGFVSDGVAAPVEDVPCYDRDDIDSVAEAIVTEQYIRTKMSMIVLSGGQSSRMGTDKANLPYGETTFLEHQIAKGRTLGIGDILVSGYRGKHCSAHVVKDVVAEKGPLGGLASTLPCACHEKCLVLTVDMPHVPVTVLRKLIHHSMSSKKAVTVLRHGYKREPLLAVYDRSVAKEMQKAVLQGKGAVMALIDKVGHEVYACEEDAHAFGNINTAEEYTAMGGEGTCTP